MEKNRNSCAIAKGAAATPTKAAVETMKVLRSMIVPHPVSQTMEQHNFRHIRQLRFPQCTAPNNQLVEDMLEACLMATPQRYCPKGF
jgi:hypothetical protein